MHCASCWRSAQQWQGQPHLFSCLRLDFRCYCSSRSCTPRCFNALGAQFHKGLEPSRYGRLGRIPGSVNVPAATLYDPTTKTLANPDDAERQFAAQGVTREKQVIAYCGGGISATIDLLLLRRLGYESLMLYDGSMGEWAKDASLPIETG